MTYERVENELNALANRVNLSAEEMNEKYNEIATANALDVENERQALVALTLTRNWVRGSLRGGNQKSSFGNTVFGYIAGIEPARDVQAWRRRTLEGEYRVNPNSVVTEGKVAEISLVDGGYEKSQVLDGELSTKNIPQLPASAIEVDEDKWIVPVDPVKAWPSGDVNKNYGKPLPTEEWRLRAHFIGRVNDDLQHWSLGLKGEAAKNFNLETYRWIHLRVVVNEERNALYGIKNQTLQGAVYNDLLDEDHEDYVDTSGLSMEDLLAEHMAEYVADLVEIEDYHDSVRDKQGLRIVLTDGIVSSLNLNVNEKTGNRVMWVEPVDANYGFEVDEIPESTPCWVPKYVDLNFGVGSDVIIIGRTNQTQAKDENGVQIDGQWNPVSINIYGVLPRVAMGITVDESSNDEEVEYW